MCGLVGSEVSLRSFDNGNSDKAKQFLLDSRAERKHQKRHRTRKRTKAAQAAKRQRIKHENAIRQKERRRLLAAARAYWSGEADGHPA